MVTFVHSYVSCFDELDGAVTAAWSTSSDAPAAPNAMASDDMFGARNGSVSASSTTSHRSGAAGSVTSSCASPLDVATMSVGVWPPFLRNDVTRTATVMGAAVGLASSSRYREK